MQNRLQIKEIMMVMGCLLASLTVFAQNPATFTPETAALVQPAATPATATSANTSIVPPALPVAAEAQTAQPLSQTIAPVPTAQTLSPQQVNLPPLPTPPPAVAAQAAQTNLPPKATAAATAAAVSGTFGTIGDPAFQDIIKKTFPLTPEQIAALRLILQENQRAAAAPADSPTPTLSTQTVVLTPGSTPPVLRLANGYVSSIVFLDETGQPWPISGYTIGNPQVFNINWDGKSNILMMQGIGKYETGNMAVQLNGLATPIMLTIVSDQTVIDYRLDFRVQGRGPLARAPLIGGTLPRQADSALLDLLEGVPPIGSQRLLVSGGPAEAWVLGQKMYIRTPLTLLSPGWEATMSSIDGTKAYEMNATPMLLAVQEGQTVTLRIEGL